MSATWCINKLVLHDLRWLIIFFKITASHAVQIQMLNILIKTWAEGFPPSSICAIHPNSSSRSVKYKSHSVSVFTDAQTRRIKKEKGSAFSNLSGSELSMLAQPVLAQTLLQRNKRGNIIRYGNRDGAGWIASISCTYIVCPFTNQTQSVYKMVAKKWLIKNQRKRVQTDATS